MIRGAVISGWLGAVVIYGGSIVATLDGLPWVQLLGHVTIGMGIGLQLAAIQMLRKTIKAHAVMDAMSGKATFDFSGKGTALGTKPFRAAIERLRASESLAWRPTLIPRDGVMAKQMKEWDTHMEMNKDAELGIFSDERLAEIKNLAEGK